MVASAKPRRARRRRACVQIVPNRALHAIFSKVNQRRQWYELPTTSLKTLNLLSLRLDLRDLNLFDTGTPIRKHGLEESPEEALTARRPDGKWNDLEDAEMGSTGTAFTRNINPKRIKPEKPPRLYDPSPRKVSLELTRDEFKPAETLNVLAQAWIQFENHNWFFHGRGKPEEVLEIPVEEGDDWPDHPMRVRRTVAVPSHSSGVGKSGNGNGSIDYGNTETHWWDGSQIYGSDQETQNAIRTFKDGKLKIGADGRLLPDQGEDGLDLTGFNENYWFGLSCLHTLFTKEHNAICDMLQKENPRLERSAAVRHRLADQRGADGQDPHGRVDPRHRQHAGAVVCDERQLVGHLRPEPQGPLRPPRRLGDRQRDHGLVAGAPRRTLPADRGVHLGLPHAPAVARRLEHLQRSER